VSLKFNVSLAEAAEGEHVFVGDQLYSFTIGADPPDGISAWEKAIPQMCLGQRCRIWAEARRAFGEEGAQPLFPPGEAVVFDLELTGWRSPMGGVVGDVEVDDDGGGEDAEDIVDVSLGDADDATVEKLRQTIPDAAPGTYEIPADSTEESEDIKELRMQLEDPDTSLGRMMMSSEQPDVEDAVDANVRAEEEHANKAKTPILDPEVVEQMRRNVSATFRLQGVSRGAAGADESSGLEHPPAYEFTERRDGIDLYIPVPAGTTKADVHCSLSRNGIAVSVANEHALPFKHTVGRIRVGDSFWTLDPDHFRDRRWAPTPVSTGPAQEASEESAPWWCVHLEISKSPPDDKIWGEVFREE